MSKRRHGLPPRDRDEWGTPWQAAIPLLQLLESNTKFIDPCCGPGDLIRHLTAVGHVCTGAFDLPTDARVTHYGIEPDAIFVTNPPWRRQFGMGDIITNLSDQRPLWALIYSDWLFTQHAAPYLPRLRAVVAVGRAKWIPDSKHSGMENCCWCLFDRPRPGAHAAIRFIGRIGRGRACVEQEAA